MNEGLSDLSLSGHRVTVYPNDQLWYFTLNKLLYLFFLGLVSKVFPSDQVIDEAIRFAENVAAFSPMLVQTAKQAVNAGKFFIVFV